MKHAIALMTMVLALGGQVPAGLVNGGFESYAPPAHSFGYHLDAGNGGIPGWNTTASDHLIEIWGHRLSWCSCI